MRDSSEAMAKLESFIAEEKATLTSGNFSYDEFTNHEFDSPDTLRHKSILEIMPLNFVVERESLKVQDKYYTRETEPSVSLEAMKWTETQEYNGNDVTDSWTDPNGGLNWPIQSEVVETVLDGRDVYQIVWEHPLSPSSMGPEHHEVLHAVRSWLEIDRNTELKDYKVDVWIDKESYFLVQVIAEYQLSSDDSNLKDLPLESDFATIVHQLRFSKFNEPIEIDTAITLAPPLSSVEILGKSSEVMANLESMSYKVDMEMDLGDFQIPISYEGDFHVPDNLKQTVSMNMMGLDIKTTLMQVDGNYYEQEFMEEEWTQSYGFEGIDPREFWTGHESFLAFPIALDPTIEDLYGSEVYKISWDLDLGSANAASNVLSILDFAEGETPEKMQVEYWIDRDSYHLRKFSVDIKMPFTEDLEEGDDAGLGMMLLGDGPMAIVMDFELFDFDQVGQIEAPSIVVSSAAPAPAPAAPAPAPAAAPASPESWIVIGERIAGISITGLGNQDWFFEGVEGQIVVIETKTTNASFVDTAITLISPSGFGEAYDDDGGDNFDSRITHVLQETGTYNIFIEDFSGRGGEYDLSLMEGSADAAAPTPLGSWISIGERIEGIPISSYGTQEWFFDGTKGKSVEIEAINADIGVATDIVLVGPDGDVETYSANSRGTDLDPHIDHVLEQTGKYTITIQNIGSTGQYGLLLLAGSTPTVINIPDSNLAASVRAELNKPDDHPITAEDMASLRGLAAEASEISNLTGLEHAVNLGVLNLVRNNIYDLEPLEGLSQLEYIDLSQNEIENLEPLRNLFGLTTLRLHENNISDLEPISGLTNLTGLYLRANTQIDDIWPISALTYLTDLEISQTDVADIQPLQYLDSLEVLLIHENQIRNASWLDALDSLSWLMLGGNPITDYGNTRERCSTGDIQTCDGVPEAVSKREIVFGGLNWDSSLVQNGVARYIVEHGFGHKTSQIEGATGPLFQELRNGDVDVLMEIWLPNQEVIWNEALLADEVISAGKSLEDNWQSTFLIPAYLQETNPGLDSVEDLKELQYKILFAEPGSSGKAVLYGCIAGWACRGVQEGNVNGPGQIVAYGLEDHVELTDPGTSGALASVIQNRFKKEEPVLFYYWGPTQLMLDLGYPEKIVELNQPSPSNCAGKDPVHGCSFPPAEVMIALNTEIASDAPYLVEFFNNWDWPAGSQLVADSWYLQNSDNYDTSEKAFEATAVWHLTNNDSWHSWVPSDVLEKVLVALAKE